MTYPSPVRKDGRRNDLGETRLAAVFYTSTSLCGWSNHVRTLDVTRATRVKVQRNSIVHSLESMLDMKYPCPRIPCSHVFDAHVLFFGKRLRHFFNVPLLDNGCSMSGRHSSVSNKLLICTYNLVELGFGNVHYIQYQSAGSERSCEHRSFRKRRDSKSGEIISDISNLPTTDSFGPNILCLSPNALEFSPYLPD